MISYDVFRNPYRALPFCTPLPFLIWLTLFPFLRSDHLSPTISFSIAPPHQNPSNGPILLYKFLKLFHICTQTWRFSTRSLWWEKINDVSLGLSYHCQYDHSIPQTFQDTVLANGCLPEVKIKYFLLKIPYISDTGFRGPWARNFRWRCHACFHRSEATNSPIQLWFLWNTITISMAW